jgi:hypothetical protein
LSISVGSVSYFKMTSFAKAMEVRGGKDRGERDKLKLGIRN